MVSLQNTWLSARVSSYKLASDGGIPQVRASHYEPNHHYGPDAERICSRTRTQAKFSPAKQAVMITAQACTVQEANTGLDTPKSWTDYLIWHCQRVCPVMNKPIVQSEIWNILPLHSAKQHSIPAPQHADNHQHLKHAKKTLQINTRKNILQKVKRLLRLILH